MNSSKSTESLLFPSRDGRAVLRDDSSSHGGAAKGKRSKLALIKLENESKQCFTANIIYGQNNTYLKLTSCHSLLNSYILSCAAVAILHYCNDLPWRCMNDFLLPGALILNFATPACFLSLLMIMRIAMKKKLRFVLVSGLIKFMIPTVGLLLLCKSVINDLNLSTSFDNFIWWARLMSLCG
jgi:hypothetical protein